MLTDFEYEYRDGTQERELRSKLTDRRANTTTTYGYDALNRLTSADTTGGSSDSWSYTYDNASNRLTKTHDGNTTTYRYDQRSQLCWSVSGPSSNACSQPPSGATTYSFDANGNLTGSSAGLDLDYNPLNQTEQITPPGSTATTFAYAGEGQTERASKTTNGTTTAFTPTLLGVSRQAADSTATGWVRDVNGTMLARRSGSGSHYYLTDALGSIAALTDPSGNVTRRYVYNDPYGEDITATGTTSDPWRFAGEYLDTETNLYKIGARYYQPSLGRWTQTDPINQAFDPRQANRYSYAGADPINLRDPSGTHNVFDSPFARDVKRSVRSPFVTDVKRVSRATGVGLLACYAVRSARDTDEGIGDTVSDLYVCSPAGIIDDAFGD